MPASTDDLFNVQKNSVTAVNGVATTIQQISGKQSALEIAASTLLKSGSGWAARVSIIVAGSAAGALYDSATVAGAVNGVRLALVQNTAGFQDIKMPFQNGLVFIPGTGMTATVSYS